MGKIRFCLREELRARDDVIRRLRASLGARFDADLEFRVMKDQVKKIQELVRKVIGEDEHRQHEDETHLCGMENKVVEGAATAGNRSAPIAAANEVLVKRGANCVARLPLEYRADILSCLDRFSLDCAAFTCPKLRAAVATLDGQNLRDLSRVEVIGVAWGEKFCPGCGGRYPEGHGNYCLGDADQRHLSAQKIITIVVDYSSDPKGLKNGASSATGTLTWQFTDTQKAGSLFIGLLRNAHLRQLSLSFWPTEFFIQALSVADVDVTVGSLTLDRFWRDPPNLPDACEALLPFNRLETLAIDVAPLELLSDHFLLKATHKRVTSIVLGSDLFCVRDGDGFRTVSASIGPDDSYPELCDGVLAFLFRDDLDVTAKVKLHFPAARVPEDLCQTLIESAITAGSGYSIDALFVPMCDINEDLVGFEEYRRLDDVHGTCVTYRVPVPDTTDVFVELTIATVENSDGYVGPHIMWKVIHFRRFREIEID